MFDQFFKKKELIFPKIDYNNYYYSIKSKLIKKIFNNEDEYLIKAHSSIYEGGALNLYLHPGYKGGTAIVTKQLVDTSFRGPKNNAYDCYELAMISRFICDVNKLPDTQSIIPKSSDEYQLKYSSFSEDFIRYQIYINLIAKYSYISNLNPLNTLEFPDEIPIVGRKCLFFLPICQPLKFKFTKNRSFGILLIMEIHRSEMDFVIKKGGMQLAQKLIDNKIYPFSYLDRNSLI